VSNLNAKKETLEVQMQKQINDLKAKCEDLQSQINKTNEERKEEANRIIEKAKESLIGKDDFNFDPAGKLSDTLVEDPDKDIPESLNHEQKLFKFKQSLGKCESVNCSFLGNLKTERFQEPRMFTMDQLRDIVYSCLNQSTTIERLNRSEI
jgi:hypothetical protein